jgi:hypothetical protein
MNKDFRNNLTLLVTATILAIIGWMANKFVDGVLFDTICSPYLCAEPFTLALSALLSVIIVLFIIILF